MEKKLLGSIHPDSILGRMVADDMRAEPSVQSLPLRIREALIRDAIVAMHEYLEVSEESISIAPTSTHVSKSSSLDAILPSFGRKSHLVIRDDDFKLLDAVCAGAQAAASAGFFLLSCTSVSEIAGTTGILVSVFKILRQLVRKAAAVDRTRIQVLLALKAQGPLTVDELVNWLNGSLTGRTDRWTNDAVVSELAEFKRVRLADGSVVSFVDETPDGKWSTSGI